MRSIRLIETRPVNPRTAAPRNRGWLLVDIVLGFMAAGPILAPLFRASGLPLFVPVGQGITALGFLICPQPEMAFQLALSLIHI